MAVPTGLICHTTQGTVGTTATAVGNTICDWFRVEIVSATGSLYLGGATMGTAATVNGYLTALTVGTTGRATGYDVRSPGAYDSAKGVNGKVFDLAKWYVAGSTSGIVYNVTYFSRLNDG